MKKTCDRCGEPLVLGLNEFYPCECPETVAPVGSLRVERLGRDKWEPVPMGPPPNPSDFTADALHRRATPFVPSVREMCRLFPVDMTSAERFEAVGRMLDKLDDEGNPVEPMIDAEGARRLLGIGGEP